MTAVLTVWTVYRNPSDFPGMWVLRGRDVPAGSQRVVAAANTLEAVRAHIPMGAIKMPRMPFDDPLIVEIWM